MITIRNGKFVRDVDIIQILSYISVTHSVAYQYMYTNLKVCILVWPHLYQAKKSYLLPCHWGSRLVIFIDFLTVVLCKYKHAT